MANTNRVPTALGSLHTRSYNHHTHTHSYLLIKETFYPFLTEEALDYGDV